MNFFCDDEPPKGKNKPIKWEGILKYLWKKSFGFHSKATDIITSSNLNVNLKETRCNSPMPKFHNFYIRITRRGRTDLPWPRWRYVVHKSPSLHLGSKCACKSRPIQSLQGKRDHFSNSDIPMSYLRYDEIHAKPTRKTRRSSSSWSELSYIRFGHKQMVVLQK